MSLSSITSIKTQCSIHQIFSAYGEGFKHLLREPAVKEYMHGEKQKDETKLIYQSGALRKIQVSTCLINYDKIARISCENYKES